MRTLFVTVFIAGVNCFWFANDAQAQTWYHHRVFDSSPIYSSYYSNAPAYTFSYTPSAVGEYFTSPGYSYSPGAVGAYYYPSTNYNPSSYSYPYTYGGYYYPGYGIRYGGRWW